MLLLAGAGILASFNLAMEATNSQAFCISCHEMESTVFQEYRGTAHAHNATGVQTECSDCHVPVEWGPKVIRKIKASRELWHWALGTIDTQEEFEARRLQLAESVWSYLESSDSRECRNCHKQTAVSELAAGRFANFYHDLAEPDATCIDCHKGITHQLPASFRFETAFTAAGEMLELSEEDREYGEEINETCAGCHGEFGEGSADGEYPRLAGMNPEYLYRQIELFKSRERLNIPMLPYATERELPGDDVRIISAYLASIDLPTALPPVDDESFNALARLKETRKVLNIPRYPGDSRDGERLYGKECLGCHGNKGYGMPARTAPRLAGQHSAYLKRQIERFRTAERQHTDTADAHLFTLFSDTEVDNILAYLSLADDS